ncbi:MAG: ATP-binding protein [Dermatophilus congolensis]|nr:ATP-binding protein [Dermatophilus congolensis]
MSTLVRRSASAFAEQALGAFPILTIQGARQVGKSTFASMLVQGRPARLLTLDDPATADAARLDPVDFVDQAPEATLVIDELQRVPSLLLALKASVDRDRRSGRFIITGSSDLLRLERTPDSLAGRAVTIDLRGFSRGELIGRHEDFVTRLLEAQDPAAFSSSWRRADVAAAIAAGGYPEATRLQGKLRRVWLDSYVTRLLQRDATEVGRVSDPARLRSMLRLIAANQAGELVKARLAEAAQLAATTVTSYLDVLQTLYLVDLIPPWTANLTRREIGRPKAVVSDSAVALRLGGSTEAQISQVVGGDHLGGLLEGFVAAELLKQRTWSDTEFELFHFRDRNGPEVDLVIELQSGGVIGVEVKASGTFRADHCAGLRFLKDRLGERFLAGVVLGTAPQAVRFGPRIWGLPVSALWEL